MRVPHHRSGHSESDKTDKITKESMEANEGNSALKVSTRYVAMARSFITSLLIIVVKWLPFEVFYLLNR